MFSSPMAFSSSSSQIKRYHVFPSFHGSDVRKRFLSHLHYHFDTKGITMFKDQEIERGYSIKPELDQAIRESRVSMVVLSKNYASSSWCLDELVEILKCKEAQGQIVMTIFYKVDPSHVRKQSGVFGDEFKKTCEGKSEDVKQSWIKALTDVANIEGEHFLKWASEAEMIQKIATDLSEKLNLTPSRDVEGMVGLEAHLTKLDSLLCLESDQVKMIGIWGPAGIGKTTIAGALYNQLFSSFPLKCFMENVKGSLKSPMSNDSKLSLQNQLLSKIFNRKDLKTYNLDAVKEWLQDQRVLIILDDVDDLEQLDVLAKELSWFGSGSRIIVTTEDKKILKAHGIQDVYHVDFPSEEEALEILCLSAFKQSSVQDGFEELANKVAKLCGNLPLGLCVVGSSLRRQSKKEWELQLSGIKASLDGGIEVILKVGYDRLTTKNQSLFLHIACFFNNEVEDYVKSVLSDSNLDVGNGLKTLVDKSLVHISTNGHIVMHHLLQQLGQQVVLGQSDEPGKRQFLIDAQDIRDVLIKETGTGSVIGISFDISNIGEVSLSKGVFEGMRNLRFLRIFYNRLLDGDGGTLQIPEDMNYLPHLRLLRWDFYPRKTLPPRFHPEHLVEINMGFSKLEKLWGGIQPLPNLKTIDLTYSDRLREIPNLSKATNLETLQLGWCHSLVELPSSISNLHKLKRLLMFGCIKLRVIPTNINLASLEEVNMNFCSQLRTFPDLSRNIKTLRVRDTMIKDFPPSVAGCGSRLRLLDWRHYLRKTLPPRFNPDCLVEIDMTSSNLEKLWGGIQPLPNLRKIDLSFSKRLREIPNLSKATNLKSIDLGCSLNLKEIPNLSKATNLETLSLVYCESLVELPSSISNLHKLKRLMMFGCKKLRVIPTNINLASLEFVDMSHCSQLRSFPDLSRNIKTLYVGDTMIKDIPSSIVGCWSRLECLEIGSRSLKRLTHAPQSITELDLSDSGIKVIPDCVISLPHLVHLKVNDCRKLVTIPALSPSLKSLEASGCVSLKRVCFSSQKSTKTLTFYNCWKLDEEARRGIIQQRVGEIWLPGKKIPAEFTHKATGKSITIPLAPGTFSASSRFKACCLILPGRGYGYRNIKCSLRSKEGVSVTVDKRYWGSDRSPQSEHLFIFHGNLFSRQSRCHGVDVTMSEIIFEFSCLDKDDKIIECGVQIMTDEAEGSSNSEVDNFETDSSSSEVDYYGTGGNNNHHTDGDGDGDYEAEAFKFSQVENIIGCWSWLWRLVGRKRR